MRLRQFFYPCLICFTLIGCALPQVFQPMRLYDLRSGNTIVVFLSPTSREHGVFTTSSNQTGNFEGEYVLLDRYSEYNREPMTPMGSKSLSTGTSIPDDFAELYGFGKASAAQPVGTGILVGTDSTVIQKVFYRVSGDKQTGDGVAKDNKGRYYRVYFSTESE